MKLAILILISVLILIGFGYLKFFRTKNLQSDPDIKVQDKNEDVPAFARVYTVKLSEGRTLQVTTKDYGPILGVIYNGELDQSSGKWVLFDPESVADKIIDRELVPVVQKYCDQILSQDKAWRDSKPSEFKDESGTIWKRVN